MNESIAIDHHVWRMRKVNKTVKEEWFNDKRVIFWMYSLPFSDTNVKWPTFYVARKIEIVERRQISTWLIWNGNSKSATNRNEKKKQSKRVANDCDKHNWIVAMLSKRTCEIRNAEVDQGHLSIFRWYVASRLMSACACVLLYRAKEWNGSHFCWEHCQRRPILFYVS